MRVAATRLMVNYVRAAIFFAALFVGVAMGHGALTGALRNAGLNGGTALFVGGAIMLTLILSATSLAQLWQRWDRRRTLEKARALGLPEHPTCIVWRGGEEGEMPWVLARPIDVHFPRIARKLGVEDYAVVDFEVSADGRAKNIHCVDAWPADIFFDAARDALAQAEFAVRDSARLPRFGPSYRMPFVFRIEGLARVTDRGRLRRGRRKPVRKKRPQSVGAQ
jgi:hypothetical protein